MTPQELRAITDLTKAINGLTKELGRKPVVPGQAIFADNIPYVKGAMSPQEIYEQSKNLLAQLHQQSDSSAVKNNEGTLQLVRDILDDQGADQNIANGIIRALEDAGIIFLEIKDSGDET